MAKKAVIKKETVVSLRSQTFLGRAEKLLSMVKTSADMITMWIALSFY